MLFHIFYILIKLNELPNFTTLLWKESKTKQGEFLQSLRLLNPRNRTSFCRNCHLYETKPEQASPMFGWTPPSAGKTVNWWCSSTDGQQQKQVWNLLNYWFKEKNKSNKKPKNIHTHTKQQQQKPSKAVANCQNSYSFHAHEKSLCFVNFYQICQLEYFKTTGIGSILKSHQF